MPRAMRRGRYKNVILLIIAAIASVTLVNVCLILSVENKLATKSRTDNQNNNAYYFGKNNANTIIPTPTPITENYNDKAAETTPRQQATEFDNPDRKSPLLNMNNVRTFYTYRAGKKVEEDAATADNYGLGIRVSVIIPVYKVKNYIERCVKSLVNQSMRDGIEFIFVDDKGDDGSIEVVEAYAQVDPRIHIVYNSRNMGSGPSRNAGIAVARGEYLSFVDPDDYVDYDFYELLYHKTAIRKYDIVKTTRVNVYQNGTHVPGRLTYALKRKLRQGKRLHDIFHFEHQTAIYRRDLIREHPDIRFGDSAAAQDCLFLLSYTFYTQSIAFVFNTNYYYCFRDDSMANRQGFDFFDGNIRSMNDRLDFLEKNDAPGAYNEYLELYKSIILVRRGLLVDSTIIDAQTKEDLLARFDDVLQRIDDLTVDLTVIT